MAHFMPDTVTPSLPVLDDERYAVFIDGANLYQTAKALGFDIDYKSLRRVFRQHGQLLRLYYYTALLDDQEYSPVRPLVDWLDYNGYSLVTKPLKEFTNVAGKRKYKGNMDIEIAVDVMEMARHVDHVVLCSGDGDFRKLIESVQRQGCKFSIISTLHTSPPMVADELRRQADHFIELRDLEPEIARVNAPRSAAAADFDDEEEDEDVEGPVR
jgi:uncharacterized LabA/DUF88 family protein